MAKRYTKRIFVLVLLLIWLPGYAFNWILNNPYPHSESNKKIYYSSFSEQPKTLDPARSYSSNEYQFISQIYEPLLQYDYFIRPYQLVPLVAKAIPTIRYLNAQLKPVMADATDIAYTTYTLQIKPGILYQPHPAFAKDKTGQYRYLNLTAAYLDENDISELADFPYTGTRELIVDDYIYQIKRLANPVINSPIYGLMNEKIMGFQEFAKVLPTSGFIDLRKYSLSGVRKIDNYTFEITLIGQYPQFIFWLAMPFFAPIPWEVDQFYSQAGMDDKNLSFAWYPVGTGAFMLSENNPNKRMILDKNPNFHEEYFPTNASKEDKQLGYAHHLGERLPLINQAIYTLEKEAIPRWNKFLQGYYDSSGISTDSYAQAIQINSQGKPILSPEMQAKKMHLTTTVDPSIYYMGFNMLDPIVGGNSERARKLRLAISIAVNYEENIAIFFNGRGIAAQGPIPPGIFGYKLGKASINPYVYRWNGNSIERRSIQDAKELLRQAGYPNGRDKSTGRALILHYDVPITGGPDDKSQLEWMRKQFANIGIDLNIRATQYNRFQEKMRNGNAQIFSWGWNADYPDPENFLFMLYGSNGKVRHGGENAANYDNQEYNKLFNLMKNRPNDMERQAIIDRMVEIVRHDAPWVWGINTETFILTQQWLSLTKPNTISLNSLKYISIDVSLRNKFRLLWNNPILWPLLVIILLLFLLLILPIFLVYRRTQRQLARRIKL
ncbi:extracellular solute-binding protein [Legionella busanensis]|uniref:Extracellular solute-binding protein n=1 Tax=Legionella busanensis TaxID=190655 RepID=A0A378JKK9_9GAMM|nr:extracellular solute-binding protein [Legionella busanensis]